MIDPDADDLGTTPYESDSPNFVLVVIDEPGDTTVRPRRPNIPLEPPRPRRPEPEPPTDEPKPS